MYGGGCPVALLAGAYAKVWEAANTLVAELSPDERAHVLGGIATRIYRLPPQAREDRT